MGPGKPIHREDSWLSGIVVPGIAMNGNGLKAKKEAEPTAACLEGRYVRYHRLLLIKWLHERVSPICIPYERVPQKCSQAHSSLTTCPDLLQTSTASSP